MMAVRRDSNKANGFACEQDQNPALALRALGMVR
jgi:hypothetical protein